MGRVTSPAGRAAIEQREGYRSKAYQDGGGVWTIGYGHTGRASSPVVLPGMKIAKEQADAFLAADLAAIEGPIDALLRFEPTQNQFDAIVSIVHTIGIPAFRGSTLLRLLNEGDPDGAAAQFLRWNKIRNPKTKVLEVSPGLVNRRQAECDQFQTASDHAPAIAVPSVVTPTVLDADAGFWARGIKALAYWLFAIPITEK